MNEYLNEQFNECLKIVEDLGITHGNIVSVKAKPTKRLANCVKDGTKYTLTFHPVLLNKKNKLALRTTLLHEILHTCRGSMNHGRYWQKNVRIVNKATGYNISRLMNITDYGITEEEYITACKPKYIYVCQNCGNKHVRFRECNLTKHIERYRCGCGGELIRA